MVSHWVFSLASVPEFRPRDLFRQLCYLRECGEEPSSFVSYYQFSVSP